MTFFDHRADGPPQEGVCQCCGAPTGDDGSLCQACDEIEWTDRVWDDGDGKITEAPFLPDDEVKDPRD